MYSFILALTFFSDVTPGITPQYHGAITQVRYALLEEKECKHDIEAFTKYSERRFNEVTGLTKEQLIYAAYAYPLIAGKISTKPFKNFKIDAGGGFTFRPQIEYKFSDGSYSGIMVLEKGF